MALDPVLASLEGISEELKDHYTEKDGKFYLSVNPVDGFALENVQGLKSSLQKERGNVSSLQQKLNQYLDIKASPEEIVAALEKVSALDKDGTVEEKIAAIKAQLEDKHSKELTKRETKVSSLLSQLEKSLIDGKAIEAINKKKGNVSLLLPHVRNRIRLIEDEEGIFRVRVKDESGKTDLLTMKPNSEGYMDVEELVDSMSKDSSYSVCFEGSGAAGGGHPGTRKAAGSRQPWQIHARDLEDVTKFRQAMREAEKKGLVAPEVIE